MTRRSEALGAAQRVGGAVPGRLVIEVLEMRNWRSVVVGMAIGNFFGYAFSGAPLRGVVCLFLYALILATIELCLYIGRHLRWE